MKKVQPDPLLKADYSKEYLAAYEALCQSYHAIDDFRAKLLGLLPLTTGAGITLLVTDKEKIALAQPFLGLIGAFGFVITLALFFYELHGIKKCGYLIATGREMERDIGVRGQFESRPHEVAGFIDEPFTASIIYPAVLAAWTYVGLNFSLSQSFPALGFIIPVAAILIFVAGFVFALKLNRAIDDDRTNGAEYVKEPVIKIFGGPGQSQTGPQESR